MFKICAKQQNDWINFKFLNNHSPSDLKGPLEELINLSLLTPNSSATKEVAGTSRGSSRGTCSSAKQGLTAGRRCSSLGTWSVTRQGWSKADINSSRSTSPKATVWWWPWSQVASTISWTRSPTAADWAVSWRCTKGGQHPQADQVPGVPQHQVLNPTASGRQRLTQARPSKQHKTENVIYETYT